jgi:hypothetical protein
MAMVSANIGSPSARKSCGDRPLQGNSNLALWGDFLLAAKGLAVRL